MENMAFVSPPRLSIVVIVGLVVVAGCTGTPLPSTDTDSSSQEKTNSSTQLNESTTAHFIFNNHHRESYNVTIYIVRYQSESQEWFPVTLTYNNGTQRTYEQFGESDARPLSYEAITRLAPATDDVIEITKHLPARSTLHIAVPNAPTDGKLLIVQYQTNSSNSPYKSHTLSSGLCYGSNASLNNYTVEGTAGVSCGNSSDIAFPNSTVRYVTTANTTSNNEYRHPHFG